MRRGLIPRSIYRASCLRRDEILSADRAGGMQERDAQPQDVRDVFDDCSRQLQHALIMPDPACVCGCRTPKCPRRELLRATVTLTLKIRAMWDQDLAIPSLMMQSAQHRLREHNNTLPQSMAGFQFPDHGQYRRRIRDSRTQAAVRSTTIVMFDPRFQN
jgi:hypothetical protein